MSDNFIFNGSLAAIDPAVFELVQRETRRQRDAIILVASESETPDAVHEAIASPFAHIYAEGYPREASRRQTESELLDIDYELAYYRRHSDPRYYKGVEYADIIEALARRRAADLFAANGIKPSQLYVNVQPLSGGPANNAVYTALLNPGDTVMGLKLSDGGHLSHGAPVNRSGTVYRSVSYSVDTKLERLNYDAIEELASAEKPRIIVAGYSAYPLAVDWQRFRAIADKVGAYLLADISHISGLVAAGVHPSPIGIADVVMTTTHKSLCGPRGAMIMTHRRDLSSKIDGAVFPGEQGGPHINTITALAVALRLADSNQFRALQQRIAANAARLAAKLQEHGLRVPFGGSETHMLVVDCKSIRIDGVPLTGDMAARILDVAGIVLNRNNIPGDRSALNPFGIRLGTVWISQRGFGDEEVDLLAEAIATVLKGCTPFYYRGSAGKLFRAKVDPAALQHARDVVHKLTKRITRQEPSGIMRKFIDATERLLDQLETTVAVRGAEAQEFLNYVLSGDLWTLAIGEAVTMRAVTPGITVDVIVECTGEHHYNLHCDNAEQAAMLAQWLSDLSDGYVDFGSLHAKLPGPIVVQTIATNQPHSAESTQSEAHTKPFCIGQDMAAQENALPAFVFEPNDNNVLRETALHDTHVAMGAKMVPFGGWDMPVWYTSVSDEHAAVRQTAGLFDVTHMGVFEVSGPGSAEFLHTVTTNDVHELPINRSHYTYLLDPDGNVIDDLLIYRQDDEHFMLVVNASNNDKDWAWLNAVNDRSVRIDNDRPWVHIQTPVTLRDLRDPQHGNDCRVDIALQGPKSRDILLAMTNDDKLAAQLRKLPWAGLTRGNLAGFDVIISRTGYTGERVAYELFVNPAHAIGFWQALLQAGEPFGIKPCGLAARDSTRTEAGLPLHGHELAGPLELKPNEAGFVSFVKLSKPFFIGRNAYLDTFLNQERTVVRFRMNDKSVRRPELGDPILDKRGKVVGIVTSCAIDSDGYLLGQAVVPQELRRTGTVIDIYQSGGGSRGLRVPNDISLGARLPRPDSATVLSRFPARN